jgi:predicted nucleotidyltransferase
MTPLATQPLGEHVCESNQMHLSTIADTDAALKTVLARFPHVLLALVFGSVARGQARFASDLDIAVAAKHALTAEQKMEIVTALAAQTGRPIDLIDLTVAPEPLLGQIVRHGRRLLGGDAAYGSLISRHLLEQADFMPYRNRILTERRTAWIGK